MQVSNIEDRKKIIMNYLGNNNRLYFNLFLLVLVIAIGIRLYYFAISWDQGLWYDEADYLVRAKSYKLDEFGDQFAVKKPFFMPFLWGLVYLAGGTDFGMKLIVLLFSIIGVVFVYLLGKEIFDEKIALIATAFFSVFWMHIFFSLRLMLEVASLALILMMAYFFWRWLYGKGELNIIWAAVSAGIGFMVFYVPSLVMLAVAAIIIIHKKLSFLKNKHLWMAVAAGLITIIPWFVSNYLHTGNPFFGVSAYGGTGECLPGYDCGFMGYLRVLPDALRMPLLLAFMAGLGYALLDLMLGIDLLWKKPEKKMEVDIFLVIWMIVVFLFFVFEVKHVEDRYIMPVFVPAIYFASFIVAKAADYLKKTNKHAALVFVIAIIVIAAYPQLTFGAAAIKSKISSFEQERYAGEWLKAHTNRGDVIITCNQGPPIMAFSERVVESFGTNATLADEIIEKHNAKYVVLNAYFGDCLFNYPEMRQDKIKPVQAFFFDKEKKQPVIIIYEVVK